MKRIMEVYKKTLEKDINWLLKYTQMVIYLARDRELNPFKPGSFYFPIIPDGAYYYHRIYTSDYYNAIETKLVSSEEMKVTIRDYLMPLFAGNWTKGLNPKRPDHPEFSPYHFREGTKKEGWCEEDPQFLVKDVYEYFWQTKDISIFKDNHEGLEAYLLEHPKYFMKDVFIHFEEEDVIDKRFQKRGYGFYDTVLLTGYICFATILYWETYNCMSEMYREIGNQEKAEFYLQLAKKIKDNFLNIFWDKEKKLLLAATEKNRQGSVWASAYAVCIGIVDENIAKEISHSLIKNYKNIVWKGQVRHMVEPEGWESVFPPSHPNCMVNRYQNGAYWGTASGWVFRAIKKTDEALADQMLKELITFYREEGAYECVYPYGYRKDLYYVASVGTIFRALIEEGYIEVDESDRLPLVGK